MITSAMNPTSTLFLRPNLSAKTLVGTSKINAEIEVIEKQRAIAWNEKPLMLKYKTPKMATIEKP